MPRLKVGWDGTRYPLDGLGLRDAVLDGEPRVMLDDNSATDNSIAIDPFQLQPGEAAQVGEAVVAALRASLTNRSPEARAPAPQIAGEWELRVEFMHGARLHRLALEQQGGDITGHQRSAQFEGPVSGAVDGEGIRFAFGGRYEASNISYRFEGKVARRRDGRHGNARRRQRPEQRRRQPQPVRRRRMGGPPGRLRPNRIDLPFLAVRKSEATAPPARRPEEGSGDGPRRCDLDPEQPDRHQQGRRGGLPHLRRQRQEPDLQAFFIQKAERCREGAVQLQQIVREMGGDPETGGSMSGAMHRFWLDIRGAISGMDDHAILDECERGEDSAKQAYEEALKEDLPGDVRRVIENQYREVKTNHDKVRPMRNATA